MRIVVIGGTGLIGSKVVDLLTSEGHQAVAASPGTGVDTVTGAGVAEAFAGARVVVDVSNSPSFDDGPAMDFFTAATGHVLSAAAAAGVAHVVALSVVGTDRLQASGYFRAKAAQERLIAESGLPYTIVHATQFFEFVGPIADVSTDGDTVRLPSALCQPIASADVATAVARAAVGDPANGIREVAGPQAYPLDELARAELRARGDARTVLTDAAAPYFGVAVEQDTLIPGPDATVFGTRYPDWLDQHAAVR